MSKAKVTASARLATDLPPVPQLKGAGEPVTVKKSEPKSPVRRAKTTAA